MGPCLCGDPYCSSCGDPNLAKIEAAADWALDTMYKAKLMAEEYKVVVSVGLAAVFHARKQAQILLNEYKSYLDEEAAYRIGG